MVPVLLWPLMLTHVDNLTTGADRFMMLAMPVYAVLTGYLASYVHADRPALAWVLIAVLWLSYIAFVALVYLG